MVNSPQTTLSFVIFWCVCSSTHFNEDVNKQSSVHKRVSAYYSRTYLQRRFWWPTHGFERCDTKLNSNQWTQRRHNVTMLEYVWLLLFVVAYPFSVLNSILEDDTKGITIGRHMGLSVLIWSIIILYEHNNNDTFWWRKNIDCNCGPSPIIPLPWPITSRLIQKGFTMIDTLFWDYDKRKILLISVGRRWWSVCCG